MRLHSPTRTPAQLAVYCIFQIHYCYRWWGILRVKQFPLNCIIYIRVYNDIVTTVGKGNGSFLVLLDLSAAFDTIDHDNLFYILEKYVGIGGSALRLIRSYFSDRTQRVQIDGIMSDFASLLCGVPQGSVLGPMKFCLYLLPLGAILRHHNIGYHIYADDTQLYISFKCKDPLESLTRLNMCISDIRVWMIKNKLKINDSKTEFKIFRSPLLKKI